MCDAMRERNAAVAGPRRDGVDDRPQTGGHPNPP